MCLCDVKVLMGHCVERAERKMAEAFDGIWQSRKRRNVSLRTAAYVVAIERVLKSTRERGFD